MSKTYLNAKRKRAQQHARQDRVRGSQRCNAAHRRGGRRLHQHGLFDALKVTVEVVHVGGQLHPREVVDAQQVAVRRGRGCQPRVRDVEHWCHIKVHVQRGNHGADTAGAVCGHCGGGVVVGGRGPLQQTARDPVHGLPAPPLHGALVARRRPPVAAQTECVPRPFSQAQPLVRHQLRLH